MFLTPFEHLGVSEMDSQCISRPDWARQSSERLQNGPKIHLFPLNRSGMIKEKHPVLEKYGPDALTSTIMFNIARICGLQSAACLCLHQPYWSWQGPVKLTSEKKNWTNTNTKERIPKKLNGSQPRQTTENKVQLRKTIKMNILYQKWKVVGRAAH